MLQYNVAECLFKVVLFPGSCALCWPKGVKYSEEIGVMNYPRKDKKSSVRHEQRLMFILRCQDKYLLLKRRSSGLLANFLEFPNFSHDADAVETATSVLKANLGFDVVAKDVKSLGEVEHVFSHVKHTYTLLTAEVDSTAAAIADHLLEYQEDGTLWLTAQKIMDTASGSSTATRKVMQLCTSSSGKSVSFSTAPDFSVVIVKILPLFLFSVAKDSPLLITRTGASVRRASQVTSEAIIRNENLRDIDTSLF
jgi:hypothetical protein